LPQGRESAAGKPKEAEMLWTISVVLLVLWLLGVAMSYTLGGFIHLLLIVAGVLAVLQLLQRRRVI
jgi:asparagine N-glycosylation enzyme membrane subunit Stt3